MAPLKNFIRGNFSLLVVGALLVLSLVVHLYGCTPKNPALDSVVFITHHLKPNEVSLSSGVLVEPGVVVGACHAMHGETPRSSRVTFPHGEEIETGPFICPDNNRDVAVARLFNPSDLPLAEAGDFKGLFHTGCIAGRRHPRGSATILVRCAPVRQKADGRVVLMGKNAKKGMSGGPCFVDGYVVGVVSRGFQRPGDEENIGPGFTYCSPIREGDLEVDHN